MQTTFALAALASVALAAPHVARDTPAGCSTSYAGSFQISILNGSSVVSKRELAQRQASTCGASGFLTSTLKDGILTDTQGRIGNIVANHQFQYDPAPGQTDSIYTDGFSICSNGSLATKGGSAVFYSCKSGDFANLYDESIAPYCLPVYIDVLPCAGTSPGATVSQQPDGQPTAATSVSAVTQISDGQAQVPTSVSAITQITDGQVQAPTTAPLAPVTQIGDGQLQMPTAAIPVTQIGDGQIQVPTTAGGKPATQIGDGQVQVPTSASKPAATQIGDGQIQVPTAVSSSKPAATQIGDGQIQVNSTTPLTVVNAGNGLMAGSVVSVVMAAGAMLLL